MPNSRVHAIHWAGTFRSAILAAASDQVSIIGCLARDIQRTVRKIHGQVPWLIMPQPYPTMRGNPSRFPTQRTVLRVIVLSTGRAEIERRIVGRRTAGTETAVVHKTVHPLTRTGIAHPVRGWFQPSTAAFRRDLRRTYSGRSRASFVPPSAAVCRCRACLRRHARPQHRCHIAGPRATNPRNRAPSKVILADVPLASDAASSSLNRHIKVNATRRARLAA